MFHVYLLLHSTFFLRLQEEKLENQKPLSPKAAHQKKKPQSAVSVDLTAFRKDRALLGKVRKAFLQFGKIKRVDLRRSVKKDNLTGLVYFKNPESIEKALDGVVRVSAL